MSAGGRIVWTLADAARDSVRAAEARVAALPGVLRVAAEGDARLIVSLAAGADPEAVRAAIGAPAAARVVYQAPTGFGDGPQLSARLLDLIRSGAKTATCGALRDYQAEGEPLPQPGAQILALDWDGQPALVYEVTAVQILPFDQVPEDFALAEGEGSFADWRAGHEAYFARTGGFDPAMPVVCERLRLIEDLTCCPA